MRNHQLSVKGIVKSSKGNDLQITGVCPCKLLKYELPLQFSYSLHTKLCFFLLGNTAKYT